MNKKPIVLGVFLILLMTIIFPVITSFKITSNKIIYVDDNNTKGPWDGSIEHPFQFIHDGIEHAKNGSTVFVFSGKYADFIWINKSINLIGEDRNTTIIDKYSENLIVIHITSRYVNISGFTIQNNPDYGVLMYKANNITISENNFYQCKYGIYLYNTSNIHIYKNNINFNKYTGIDTYQSYSTLITENNIKNNSKGINQESSSSVIQSNNISGNKYGIEFHDCSNSRIKENKIISNNYRGINLLKVSKSEITNNIISDNGAVYRYNPQRIGHGFYLTYSSNCIINKNIVDYNDRGITIIYSENNTISKNNISNNPRTGIYLSDLFNNQIYLNNFINNNIQAYDNRLNSWDCNEKGNYWDDFEERYPDAHKTPRGVWDTPYEINNDNLDRYPLLKPYISSKIHLTRLNNIIYVDDDGNADYTRIQDAIDNASDGDTIYVYNGIYYENILVDKSIDLIGEDKNNTIIDGDKAGNVVYVSAKEVEIDGFTIRNGGTNEYLDWNVGIISSSNNNIFRNNIFLNNSHGIILFTSNNNTICNNTLSDNGIGILLTGNIIYNSSNTIIKPSINNTICYNNINNNNYCGILLGISNENYISNNIIFNNSRDGIILAGLNNHNNNITSNKVFGNKIGLAIEGTSMPYPGMNSSSNHNIVDNEIFDNELGISVNYLQAGIIENIHIKSCKIYQNDIGISLDTVYKISIKNNTIIFNRIGIKGIGIINEHNKILNNTITNNIEEGILLYRCKFLISCNTISFNIGSGISLNEVWNSRISKNEIRENCIFGIYIKDCLNNIIFLNNFIKNKKHANFENCDNVTWDGNYWGRPRLLPYPIFGKTAFKDYVIPWINIDWHPALKPYDIDSNTVVT